MQTIINEYDFNPFTEMNINSEFFNEWLKDYGAPRKSEQRRSIRIIPRVSNRMETRV